VLLIVAAGVAAFEVKQTQDQSREMEQLRTAVAKAEEHARQDARQIAADEKKAKALDAESAALRKEIKTLRAEAAVAPSAPVASATTGNAEASSTPKPAAKEGVAGLLEKMMKNPETRKAMAKQQMMVMRQFYGDFVKQQHMTPEQADKFHELLGERQMMMMDAGFKIMQDSEGSPAQDMTAQQDANNKSFKDLLGADGFAAMEKYDKTIGARAQLWQLSQQMTDPGTVLTDSQRQGLLQIFTEESARTPKPFKENDPHAMQQFASGMSDAALQDYIQKAQDGSQRVRLRAMGILNQQQMKAFDANQTQMLEMQKASFQMMRGKSQ